MNTETRLRGVRIIYATSVPFFLATQLKSQILYLSGIGMRITALTSRGPELERIPWSDSLTHEAVDIRRKPAPWRDLLTLARLILIFARRHPVIVHSTTPKTGLLAALAGWITRAPIRIHTFTGQPWVTMKGPVRWISRMADRLIVRLNSHCYADSASQRQFLIDEGIAPANRISVLGGGSLAGVDTARFDRERWPEPKREALRQQYGIGHDAKVLVFIGRIARDKGIHELLAAFEGLVTSGHDGHLLLVGPSDEECGGESFLVSGAPRAAGRIHAVGYTDEPERYLAIADMLCLPSYREGFGTVVIEAAAMRVPTVGTRITGLSDAVVDGVTGLLVPPRDAAALEAALRRLLENPVLCKQLGKAARERCLHKFDAQVVNRRMAEEYVRLLARAKAGLSHA